MSSIPGYHDSKSWALLEDPVVHSERLNEIRNKKGYIIDMDGVIYHVCITLLSPPTTPKILLKRSTNQPIMQLGI